MAYDNNGARIGAAGHFASRITSALIASGQVNLATAMDTFADLSTQALDVMNSLDGNTVAAVSNVIQAEFAGTEVQKAPEAAAPTVSAPAVALNVKGDQHGALPAWIFEAAADAGVSEIWDNRNQLAENPKRPWFRQANPAEGVKPVAFWPDTK